jgi:hypothetical protein
MDSFFKCSNSNQYFYSVHPGYYSRRSLLIGSLLSNRMAPDLALLYALVSYAAQAVFIFINDFLIRCMYLISEAFNISYLTTINSIVCIHLHQWAAPKGAGQKFFSWQFASSDTFLFRIIHLLKTCISSGEATRRGEKHAFRLAI